MSDLPKTELFHVNPRKVERNPDNPRMLFDSEELETLQQSIKLRGVLVPLIVFRKKENDEHFILLDGERRLKCAKELGLPLVPVNEIKKPSREENLIRMFNIHTVRDPWELVPTAYSLETLIQLLEKQGVKTTNTELSKLTGMKSVRIAECKRILKYKKYLHLSLDTDPQKRIGGDFFSQLDIALESIEKNFPEILKEYSRDKLVQIMIKKKQEGTIVNLIQEFRTLRKILASKKKGVEKNRIIQNVREYIASTPSKEIDKSGTPKSKAMSMDELYQKTSSSIYTENEIIKTVKTLQNLLHKIDYSEVKNKQEFKNTLGELVSQINRLLKN